MIVALSNFETAVVIFILAFFAFACIYIMYDVSPTRILEEEQERAERETLDALWDDDVDDASWGDAA